MRSCDPPIVAIPGAPGCAHGYFHPVIDELAKRRRVVYFDALGGGKSDHRCQRDVDELEVLRKAPKLSRET